LCAQAAVVRTTAIDKHACAALSFILRAPPRREK
jgi:hypothetical protein